MYKIIVALAGILMASPLLAASTPVGEFYWVEGETNLPTINLDSIKKAGTSTRWMYAIDCSDQQVDFTEIEKKTDNGQSSSADAISSSSSVSNSSSSVSSKTAAATSLPLFKCLSEDSSLTIKLIAGKTGVGKIKITAIPTQDGQTTNENFYYTVRVVAEPTSKIEECISWGCPLHTAFYMGYEGTSVSQVNEKGNLRIQYSGYSEIADSFHIYGDVMQTSLQEKSAIPETCSEDNTSDECDVDATIATNLGLYWVPVEFDSGIKMGLMAEYGLQKLDTTDVFAKSYYGGIRFAYNKIRFFSIGYGKSDGIPGHRAEFTGQLPIYDEKLIVGMNLNVSVDDTAEELGSSAGDSMNIYIMTRVDFTRIFTSFTGD